MALEIATCAVAAGRLEIDGESVHPQRLLDIASSDVDPVSHQRLWDPLDVAADVRVESCVATHDHVSVTLDTGHHLTLDQPTLAVLLGRAETTPTPTPRPWMARDTDVPIIDYRRLGDPASTDTALIEALTAFFELGCFVLTGAPAEAGALHEITQHFGRISATNFGDLFDVRTEPQPVDLAYTPVALSAHTDQPYRAPVPGLQFLHTIVNDAPGGASTMVDGLGAAKALAIADPEAHAVLTSLPIEFRYDIGTDTKRSCAPLIDCAPDGSFRQIRFSPRLDFAPHADPDVLDVYYRGRRWLAAALNDPDRQVEYRMRSGDVVVVDNHRVLHGRTAFDPTRGSRHLQGCYIDHDGPATAWTLAHRRRTERMH